MCRLAGFKNNEAVDKGVLASMRDCLSYGGPDSAGEYIDDDILLGHRRLSILDLSEAGNQPMHDGPLTMVFNGEVFNYQEIKTKLQAEGEVFQTTTDSEVILRSFRKYGKSCVDQFRGFFLIVIWNRDTKELHLCRDRVGVKPLYYYSQDGHFAFGSELKALMKYPPLDKTIDQEAVSLYLQQGYIPAPHSIFRHCKKMLPGSWLTVKSDGALSETIYWDAEERFLESETYARSEEDAIDQLEEILVESFKLRMVADVPVGMFLSGGIDSSVVTGILQKHTSGNVKTFTIGFDDPEHNEAQHAKEISRHLGTDHTELYISESDFERVVPLLPDMFDEPFGDSSGIPTRIVAELAKEKVTVSLSADGGDEIFGGYTKYEAAQKFVSKISKVPNPLRKVAAGVGSLADPYSVERVAAKLPVLKNYKNVGNKLPKLLRALDSKNVEEFFNASSSYIAQSDLQKLYPVFKKRLNLPENYPQGRLISLLGMGDIKTYLEGDIMTKVDRTTMQVALEGREPLLDQHVIEFGLALPDHLKIKDNRPKYLLRKVLERYVPREMFERPKQGFSIPIEKWLRGSYSQEIITMTQDNEFIQAFQFNQTELERKVDVFLKNTTFINPHFIWFLFMLYRWYNRWMTS